jgi:xanthine dehydrogenase iron-sulfur cluster and FAD-binding subunit A
MVPKAAMMPWMELDNTVTPYTGESPWRKGVGEAGTIGSTPAVVNAVLDASPHLGSRTSICPYDLNEFGARFKKPQETGRMIPATFDYHTPTSLNEVLALLDLYGDEAKILAGGHSLSPGVETPLSSIGHLIDIGRLTDLAFLKENGGRLTISTDDTLSGGILRTFVAKMSSARRMRLSYRRRASPQSWNDWGQLSAR